MTYWQDFTSIPSTEYTWAGSPFSTPPGIEIRYGTVLTTYGFSNNEKVFYYRSAPSVPSLYFLPVLDTNVGGQYAGLRLDDGTDNNYAEFVVQWQNANPPLLYLIYYRTGGGTVNTVTPTILPSSDFLPDNILIQILGTQWTNWAGQIILVQRYALIRIGAATPYFAWNPSRIGYVGRHGTASWARSGIDFIAW